MTASQIQDQKWTACWLHALHNNK